ncbi:MAG: hypothetical protein E7271_04930 [Lachnospiraceae bacterium]|jgi:hypothetical protein|nr:hypothetical protein [Lachnospiraceae bacterium]
MLTLIFVVLLIAVVIKILVFALKAAWGITRIVLSVVLFPIIFIALALTGFISVAIVGLIVVGLISIIGGLIIK